MKGLEVEEALRKMMGHIHPDGEAQKISSLMRTFQEAYIRQNPEKAGQEFHDPETIETLAYSILMLHTDLYNPNVKRHGRRMTVGDFIKNNQGIDGGRDLPNERLASIYSRIEAAEFKTLPDLTDKLRYIDRLLIGPLKPETFVQRYRRFIGWTFAQEVSEELLVSKRSIELNPDDDIIAGKKR
ncbi:unnamed protein product [Protopolystoma xenopodis]|uniref:SEC7 domain-containing protein n=1 Tax=Protopolystoma xenopodis TaxID=117903 RepID=A0A3S5APS6_9PLAT|nr:unnamed protein product [Protopolystoma xenopodis]